MVLLEIFEVLEPFTNKYFVTEPSYFLVEILKGKPKGKLFFLDFLYNLAKHKNINYFFGQSIYNTPGDIIISTANM